VARDLLKPLAFALLCAIWGSTWLVIKVGYGGLGAFNVASLRFFLAGGLLLLMLPLLRQRLPRGREEWLLTLWVGTALFAANYGLVYWGEQWLDSGLTSILFAVLPIGTAFLAHAYLPEDRITPRKLGGAFLALLGVGALFADSIDLGQARVVPMIAIVAGTLCAGAASVATKRHGATMRPATLNAPAMLVGAVLLALASLVAGDGYHLPTDGVTWGAIAYLAIAGSIVTFLIFFWLLKAWPATTMSYISVFTPVLALVLGFMVLHERPTWWTALGGVLILCGVTLALTKPRTGEKT